MRTTFPLATYAVATSIIRLTPAPLCQLAIGPHNDVDRVRLRVGELDRLFASLLDRLSDLWRDSGHWFLLRTIIDIRGTTVFAGIAIHGPTLSSPEIRWFRLRLEAATESLILRRCLLSAILDGRIHRVLGAFDSCKLAFTCLWAETSEGLRKLRAEEMASLLTEIARQVSMAELLRNQRGPKTPPDKMPV
jgi:hypothetical protein